MWQRNATIAPQIKRFFVQRQLPVRLALNARSSTLPVRYKYYINKYKVILGINQVNLGYFLSDSLPEYGRHIQTRSFGRQFEK
jgi:hypothetical protein